MLRPPRLEAGDTVRLILSSGRIAVESAKQTLESWGLKVEVGLPPLDEAGYSPAADERRLAELNDAIRDKTVRAIFVSADGDGVHRIAQRLDFDAARRDPKPVIGLGQTTHLHLALWKQCGLAGVHGTPSAALRQVLMTTEPVVLQRNPDDISAQVSHEGRAAGVLIGGSLSALTRSVGAGLPSLDGAILCIADTRVIGLGVVDRALTQLLRSGVPRGLSGVALGRFIGFDGYVDRDWTLIDVLRDRFAKFGVPVIGGLQFGDGPENVPLPIGTEATFDTATGILTAEPAVS